MGTIVSKSVVSMVGRDEGIELLLNEVEAESQATTAGDTVQSLVVSKGGCIRLYIKAHQTLMGF